MSTRLFFFLYFLSFQFFLPAALKIEKTTYNLTNDPIDVVILAHPKDISTLGHCIDGIKKNCENLGRVIVVSSVQLSDKCEWYDEKNFPFSLNDVVLAVGREDKKTADKYFYKHWRPPGWYLQQLLKLYAPFVIPNLSSNVLILDSDTIFMNPVKFLNKSNGALFCVSHLKPKQRYLKFAQRLLPDYKPVHTEVYSICHHMLFQRPILEDLFRRVEAYHNNIPFWKAFCYSVDLGKYKGASEYETYYNFALNHTNQVEIRELKWKNSGDLNKRKEYQKEGFHFVSFQDYMRK